MDAWDYEVEPRSTMSTASGPICVFTSPQSAGNGAKRLTGKQQTIDGAVPCIMSHVNVSLSFLLSFHHILLLLPEKFTGQFAASLSHLYADLPIHHLDASPCRPFFPASPRPRAFLY